MSDAKKGFGVRRFRKRLDRDVADDFRQPIATMHTHENGENDRPVGDDGVSKEASYDEQVEHAKRRFVARPNAERQ